MIRDLPDLAREVLGHQILETAAQGVRSSRPDLVGIDTRLEEIVRLGLLVGERLHLHPRHEDIAKVAVGVELSRRSGGGECRHFRAVVVHFDHGELTAQVWVMQQREQPRPFQYPDPATNTGALHEFGGDVVMER